MSLSDRRRDGTKEREVEGKNITWWVIDAEIRVGSPSCHQPVLNTSNGPHPFVNHQQTTERKDVALFYVCSQTSVATKLENTHESTDLRQGSPVLNNLSKKFHAYNYVNICKQSNPQTNAET